jgi:glutathione S-transferase
MSTLKLYGVPLSQPFRSVAWTLLQLGVKFEVKLTVPGMSSKMGSRNELYTSLTPHGHGQVPLLVDGDVAISESPAIMAYLCERYGNGKLYAPSGTTQKALVDSYLHWHHTGTRQLSKPFASKVRADLKYDKLLSEEEEERIQHLLKTLDSGWLKSSSSWIAGSPTPTIADILCFGEVSTVTMTKLVDLEQSSYPNLKDWTQRMAELPYYNEAHVALTTLGDLSQEKDSKAIQKKLGVATKAGLEALKSAQEGFDDEPQSKLHSSL